MSANAEIVLGLVKDALDAQDALDLVLKSHKVDLWSDARQWPVSCRSALNVKLIADACVRSAMLDEPFEQPKLVPIMGEEIRGEALPLDVPDEATAIIKNWLDRLGVGFNPHTVGSEYVNVATGANALSGLEQGAYDSDMKRLFRLCDDPEGAALRVVLDMGLLTQAA